MTSYDPADKLNGCRFEDEVCLVNHISFLLVELVQNGGVVGEALCGHTAKGIKLILSLPLTLKQKLHPTSETV